MLLARCGLRRAASGVICRQPFLQPSLGHLARWSAGWIERCSQVIEVDPTWFPGSRSCSIRRSAQQEQEFRRGMACDAAGTGEADQAQVMEGSRAFPSGESPSAFESKIGVNAYYLDRDVDIEGLSGSYLYKSLEQTARNDYVTINITPLMARTARQSLVTFTATRKVPPQPEGSDGEESSESPSYITLVTSYESSFVVAFRYGGVVFFNVEDADSRARYLEEIARYASNGTAAYGGGIEKPAARSEDFSVIVDARQREWSQLMNDNLRLRCLDMNNIIVISRVLGQSVALDHYHAKVDSMLKEFSKINIEMELTGNFKIPKKTLFQIVGQNNMTYSDSITKIKLLEKPSDVAWKYAHYGAIWEQMRGEFELEERFQRLSLKLELMQQNVKYFLEILQNRKSDTLEWIIIVLIATEIMLCLYDIYDRQVEKKERLEEKRREKEEGTTLA
ncbi:DUF155 domain-containing protein [Chloropicon primus]|uniref:DUF155 domain-containing protein n=2 Tax=Chloropicon primus TaxID=1764295 RepID=A0A5B8MYB0_9CHLO|nr:hypothetical protein A3770_13p70380 [Chloropicon primus]UPR03728.1 DUF155 domain-containing protein [Chloropicon primus]|eukprot:QDZ24520.1 hypothetical protein A3770_13p70380 [Chloropicon primus]